MAEEADTEGLRNRPAPSRGEQCTVAASHLPGTLTIRWKGVLELPHWAPS